MKVKESFEGLMFVLWLIAFFIAMVAPFICMFGSKGLTKKDR